MILPAFLFFGTDSTDVTVFFSFESGQAGFQRGTILLCAEATHCELRDISPNISSLSLILGTDYADYTVFGFFILALKFRHLNY